MTRGCPAFRAALILEVRKLVRAPVARIATASVFVVNLITTIGGYAAATHAGRTELGRKASGLVAAPGWPGFTGLAATGIGITMLLASGIVMAWSAGREFTDNTVVGLFAVPPRPATIAAAKLTTTLAWVVLLSSTTAVAAGLGGLALGLPWAGAGLHAGVIAAAGALLGAAATPCMWVATRWRGYLPGIGAALALVVVSNVAAGFGFGHYIPWTIPVLWATPGTQTPAGLLLAPLIVGALGAWGTLHSWRTLQLGAS